MTTKNMYAEKHFTVCDLCSLAEVLHPDREELPYDSYSLSHAVLAAGGETLSHRLRSSSETYVILGGIGRLFIGGETVELKRGVCAVVPPAVLQHVKNDGETELEFLCLVTPPWRAEDEEILN